MALTVGVFVPGVDVFPVTAIGHEVLEIFKEVGLCLLPRSRFQCKSLSQRRVIMASV